MTVGILDDLFGFRRSPKRRETVQRAEQRNWAALKEIEAAVRASPAMASNGLYSELEQLIRGEPPPRVPTLRRQGNGR